MTFDAQRQPFIRHDRDIFSDDIPVVFVLDRDTLSIRPRVVFQWTTCIRSLVTFLQLTKISDQTTRPESVGRWAQFCSLFDGTTQSSYVIHGVINL